VRRRTFLKAMSALIGLYPINTLAKSKDEEERALSLYNTHTGEPLDIVYFKGGYIGDSLKRLNEFLRCPYTNEVKEISVEVIDLLFRIKTRIGGNPLIEIISGYRSPLYNEYLRSIGRGVSRNSLHTKGLAIDFIIKGVGIGKLYSIARSFEMGGVGRYPDFVHIDVGPVRHW